MHVLVTGGSGYLGRHVVASTRAMGATVRALVRKQPAHPFTDVDIFVADLVTSDLAGAVAGIDVVIHVAALLQGSLDEMIRVNEKGTGRLLDAMDAAGCRRIVLASSISVLDWSSARFLDDACALLDEKSARAAGSYAQTKLHQEMMVREWGRKRGAAVAILRPGVIWGDGSWGEYALGPRLGPLRAVIGPKRRPRLAHVENVAKAFACAATRLDAAQELTANLIDDLAPTAWEYAGVLARRSGTLRLPIPQTLCAMGASLLRRVNNQEALPYFLRDQVFASVFTDVTYRNDRYRDLVGPNALLSFQGAIAREQSNQ